jgi:AcrR family transcriptional regulator
VAVAGLRERKKEHTREAMFRTALRLFAKRGFDRVTVEEIAAACDVSPRTFFRYFASKEDVLFVESDGHCARLLESIAAYDARASAFDTLEAAMLGVAADYERQRDVLLLRRSIMASTPSLRTRAAERQQSWESQIVEHLRESRRARRLSDLDLRLLVAATIAALRVAIELWSATDDGADLTDIARAAFRRLRSGFDR